MPLAIQKFESLAPSEVTFLSATSYKGVLVQIEWSSGAADLYDCFNNKGSIQASVIQCL